jgi:hypothetical protein
MTDKHLAVGIESPELESNFQIQGWHLPTGKIAVGSVRKLVAAVVETGNSVVAGKVDRAVGHRIEVVAGQG